MNSHNFTALLHDCQHLVREFFPLLSVASSQMYVSVPAFLPKNTELLKTYDQAFQSSVKILHHSNRPQHWNACLWTLEGHTASATAAIFSAGDKYIVSASNDHTMQFWDASSGTPVKKLQAHSGAVSCVASSKDGTYLLTGSHDCTVKMWNTATRELLYTMKGHKNHVTCVAFSPDGDRKSVV